MKTPNMFLEARTGGRGLNWAVELLVFILVFIVGSLLEELPLLITLAAWIMRHPELLSSVFAGDMGSGVLSAAEGLARNLPSWYFLLNLFCTALMTIVCIAFCHIVQKRGPSTLGFRRSHALREYLVGGAAAVVAMSAVVGLGLLTGVYTIRPGTGASAGAILLYFAGYLIQGMSEEVLCRGYLMVSIARKNPPWLAVSLSALAFAALHLANFGFTWLAFVNILVFGVFMSLYVLKRGNLWGVCAFHGLWNFVQGQVYGFSVSGLNAGPSLFTVDTTGAALWSGGVFGAEGGLLVSLVLAVGLCLLLFVVPAKRDEFPADALS